MGVWKENNLNENKYLEFYDLGMFFFCRVKFRFTLEAFSNYSELLLSKFS